MTHNSDSYTDRYEVFEEQFDPLRSDRQARRKRKPKVKHIPKKAETQVIAEITSGSGGGEAGFSTTYIPGLFEQGWLMSSLREFFDQELIDDVLGRVKGGKEASVYRCQARPATGLDLVAAKVYRPRMFRNLRNDKMYREGREILNEDGKVAKKNDHRMMRAIDKKSDFGQKMEHTSWLMYEYTTLDLLHKAGAAVPKPLSAGSNAILMSYCGDEAGAAPALSEVELDPDEAMPLFRETLRNIDLMLEHDFIHGDLSAYNILYWEGAITLIDFPQVTHASSNGQAYFILKRDIERVCEYFARQGVKSDPAMLLDRSWERHIGNKRPILMPQDEWEEEDEG